MIKTGANNLLLLSSNILIRNAIWCCLGSNNALEYRITVTCTSFMRKLLLRLKFMLKLLHVLDRHIYKTVVICRCHIFDIFYHTLLMLMLRFALCLCHDISQGSLEIYADLLVVIPAW